MSILVILTALAAVASIQLSDWEQQLSDAVTEERLVDLRRLTANSKNLNFEDSGGATPLIHAVLTQNSSIVRALLETGADVNFRTGRGDSALSVAASAGKPEIVKLLLSKRADVKHANRDGITPLMYAVESGSEEKVKLLLRAGAPVDLRTGTGESALMVASRKNDEQSVALLLKAKANPNLKSGDFHTALYYAVLASNETIVRDLFRHGALLCTNLPSGKPVFEAKAKANQRIQAMLARHARSCDDETDGGGETASLQPRGDLNNRLLNAVEQRNLSEAEQLLKSGADPGYHPSSYQPLFYLAIRTGDIDWVRLFLKYKVDVNMSRLGYSAIHLAAEEASEAIVKDLLDAGADPNRVDMIGETALMAAVHGGGLELSSYY